jgi:hypothetical protein
MAAYGSKPPSAVTLRRCTSAPRNYARQALHRLRSLPAPFCDLALPSYPTPAPPTRDEDGGGGSDEVGRSSSGFEPSSSRSEGRDGG